MYNENIKRLPDAYRKDKNSNNYKLLHLNELATQQLYEDFESVLDTLDLNLATGKTLDLYGQILGKKRGVLTDTQYRVVLFNEIGVKLSQGDYNSVVTMLAQIFNCDKQEIALKDVGTNKVDVVKLSVNTLANAGFTGEQAVKMVELLLPACVSVNTANFEGTFEFGDVTANETSQGMTFEALSQYTFSELTEQTYKTLEGTLSLEYDEQAGFGNIEQTIGGYLGDIIQNN